MTHDHPSNGVLPAQSNGTKAFNGDGAPEKGKKRANEEEETSSAPQAKAARRTLDSAVTKDAEEEKVVEAVKRKGRRSLAVVPTPASPAVGRLKLVSRHFDGYFRGIEYIEIKFQGEQEKVFVRVDQRCQLSVPLPRHEGTPGFS